MSITPYILLGSGRLKPFTEQIYEAVKEAIGRVNNKVSISNVDIVIYDNPHGAIPEIGVGGYTPDAHVVFISLDPDFSQFEDTLSKELGRILTHELHHVLRWKSPGYGETLLEALITEGLADHFDVEVNKNEPESWCTILSKKQILDLLAKARKEFDNKNYDHNAWFFGSEDKGIPRWAGYSLGFELVNEYLQKYPEKKPSNIYTLRAEEFIK